MSNHSGLTNRDVVILAKETGQFIKQGYSRKMAIRRVFQNHKITMTTEGIRAVGQVINQKK